MILIDTNIVLDYLLEQEPFIQDAEALFEAINFGPVLSVRQLLEQLE